jgi:hypothetical protein
LASETDFRLKMSSFGGRVRVETEPSAEPNKHSAEPVIFEASSEVGHQATHATVWRSRSGLGFRAVPEFDKSLVAR